MYSNCARLVVLKVVSPEKAEIVYDGPGAPVWETVTEGNKPLPKNGQRSISLTKLRQIAKRG